MTKKGLNDPGIRNIANETTHLVNKSYPEVISDTRLLRKRPPMLYLQVTKERRIK